MNLPGPFLVDDLDDSSGVLDLGSLDDELLLAVDDGAERIRLIEFIWETSIGPQPVLYLERQFLD